MANCILRLRMLPELWQKDKLNNTFLCVEKMQNSLIEHAIECLKSLNEDEEYQHLLKRLKEIQEEKKTRKKAGIVGTYLMEVKESYVKDRLAEIRYEHGLSDYQFQSYVAKMKNESYQGVFNIHIAQKIATRVWAATSKVLFGNGKKLHFKKHGSVESFEAKNNDTGIIFNKENYTVTFRGMIIPVKIRKNDWYAKEMLTKRTCYCRIVRLPFENGYKYFVELVLDGIPPQKHSLGKGNVGIDPGTSTNTVMAENDAFITALGNNMSVEHNKTIKDYNKEISRLSRKLERQRRLANPDNYNEDGTIKKGKHKWVKTKGYYKTLFELKAAYRRKSAFVKQNHYKAINRTVESGDRFITEKMDWKKFGKKFKKTEKSDKTIEVTNSKGETKTVRKNKRKFNFRKSLNNYSPGLYEALLKQKLGYYGVELEYVNMKTYRASQFNPETMEYIRSQLSERYKVLWDKLIQRDLLSAFELQYPMDDLKSIDIEKIQKNLDRFFELHDKAIQEIIDVPNLPACVGIKEFRKLANN